MLNGTENILEYRNYAMDKPTIAVIGLGYVGLSLAMEFAKKYHVIGYDISEKKISEYQKGRDPSGELSSENFQAAKNLLFTADPALISSADVIIIAVPTPVDMAHTPDFLPLINASTTVAKHMRRGATVVYESTVYPGATEEVCLPILEKNSGLQWKKDFFIAYSPERFNPGDKERTISKIIKVVSGDCDETLEKIANLYASIISAGIHRVSSIKVAEAAKVIENTQRDLNIALMNELAIIFDKMNIDTKEVLDAAGTKWNFLKFLPGLVGGHCIGVDPYYLTHKAETLGYHPQIVLSGRRINDGMGQFIAQKTVKLMIQSNINVRSATVNVLGLTFKEDCKDLRNSRVPDVVRELESYGISVFLHDPIGDFDQALAEYGYSLRELSSLPKADALIIAVPHRFYRAMSVTKLCDLVKDNGCIIDVKSIVDVNYIKLAKPNINFWRL